MLEIADEILSGLIEAIDGLPQAQAALQSRQIVQLDGSHVDAVLDVQLRGQQFILLVEVKREVFPRDVHHAVFQLRRYARQVTSAGSRYIPMLAARSISDGARNVLVAEEIAFYDLGGSLFLPTEAAYILIERPRIKAARKAMGSVFDGQKGRVLQVAFEQRGAWMNVKELADIARVAPSTASTTLTELERREWAVSEGSGPSKMRRIVNGQALLDEWTSHARSKKPSKMARYYVPASDARDLAHRLDHICRQHNARYAITGEVAAQAYSPYLSNISQLRCRIEPGAAQWRVLQDMDARPVSEGWNLGIIEAKSDEIRVVESNHDLCLAPPIQVYLDLLQGSGRSKEMAEHFRHEQLQHP